MISQSVFLRLRVHQEPPLTARLDMLPGEPPAGSPPRLTLFPHSFLLDDVCSGEGFWADMRYLIDTLGELGMCTRISCQRGSNYRNNWLVLDIPPS